MARPVQSHEIPRSLWVPSKSDIPCSVTMAGTHPHTSLPAPAPPCQAEQQGKAAPLWQSPFKHIRSVPRCTPSATLCPWPCRWGTARGAQLISIPEPRATAEGQGQSDRHHPASPGATGCLQAGPLARGRKRRTPMALSWEMTKVPDTPLPLSLALGADLGLSDLLKPHPKLHFSPNCSVKP